MDCVLLCTVCILALRAGVRAKSCGHVSLCPVEGLFDGTVASIVRQCAGLLKARLDLRAFSFVCMYEQLVKAGYVTRVREDRHAPIGALDGRMDVSALWTGWSGGKFFPFVSPMNQ